METIKIIAMPSVLATNQFSLT